LTGKTDNKCRGDVYRMARVEQAVISALDEAVKRPEVIRTAIQVYSEQTHLPVTADSAKEELRKIDQALEKLKQTETATIQSQIAGVRAGASPDAYAEVFADLAAQRKDLENRRGVLCHFRDSRSSYEAATVKLAPSEKLNYSLTDTHTALSSDALSGAEKRALVGTVLDKVVCNKEGADIYFLPGVFGETGEEVGGVSSFHTTCIGISTQK
jgi:hypothetical protein